MREDLRKHLERLESLAVEVKHAREQVEAKFKDLNGVIQQLGDAVPPEIFLGKAFSRPYDLESGRTESGQVVQAALLVPEGFGVCRFDTEDDQDEIKRNASDSFVPFTECAPVELAFLHQEIDGLFERFAKWASDWSIMRKS